MKYRYLITLFIISLSACPQTQSVPKIERLTLLAINDFHGHLNPLEFVANQPNNQLIRVGGAEALLATITHMRKQNPERTLLVDNGDFMQGTLLSNRFEGKPVSDLFQALKVEATVLGNHEFDFGPIGPDAIKMSENQNSRGALFTWIKNAKIPVLAANIVVKQNKKPIDWPGVRPSLLVNKAGIKVGLIGLSTTHTKSTTLPQNVEDLEFTSLKPAIEKEAAKLRKAGAQAIVVLAHVGAHCASRESKSCKGELIDTLKTLPKGLVDVVFAGHSHRCVWHKINDIFVSESCSKGIAVGKVDLVFENGKLDRNRSKIYPPTLNCHDVFTDTNNCEIKRKRPTNTSIIENPLLKKYGSEVEKLRERLAPYRNEIKHIAGETLIYVEKPILHRYHGPSEVGYLFAKVLKESTGADLAIMNAGGVRGSIAAGDLTYQRLFSIFPFDNQVSTLLVKGSTLIEMFKASFSRPHAGVLQIYGMNVHISCEHKKIEFLKITTPKGDPIDPQKEYKLALSDFMLAGGDGFRPFVKKITDEKKKIYEGKKIRDAVADFLRKHKERMINRKDRPIIGANEGIIIHHGPCGQSKDASSYLCR